MIPSIFGKKKDDPPVGCLQRIKMFMAAHWKGVLILLLPLVLSYMLFPFPPPLWKWTAYTLIIVATFWVTEVIPLAITSYLPAFIFPMTGVMDTKTVCACYVNDSVLMFLGSLLLAYSVEQSGLHKRLAYFTIRVIGYSHMKLLGAMAVVTTFVSMWITNTAATTMVVPINFALLKVFENEGLLKIYETNADGEHYASKITTCYFCSATFSATIGGIGTLVGTATNLVFKGLFMTAYPKAPEYLSFPKFSAFTVPYMIILEVLHYICFCVLFFGFLRKGSKAAKSAVITPEGIAAAKKTIQTETAKLGRIKYWEVMVFFLFGGAMIGFFTRSPQIFYGWGDHIKDHFGITKSSFVRDSAVALGVCFLMFLVPNNAHFWKNFTAKTREELPKTTIPGVLIWKPIAAIMPFSFSFLLGGGFALSKAAKSSGLNEVLGEYLKALQAVPSEVILFLIIVITIFVTNFASNVAVANVFCPISMQVAKEINQNPLLYCTAVGIAASFCFMFPVGTPGNLVVKSSAHVGTIQMMKAGAPLTICTLIISWLAFLFWAPIIWPDMKKMPDWIEP